MPVTPLKNLAYQVLLPFQAPSPKNQMRHLAEGRNLNDLAEYEAFLCRHHVLGSSLLMKQGQDTCKVFTSTMTKPVHEATPETLFRTASITKMATSAVVMTLIGDGAFALDTPVNDLLPIPEMSCLSGITVEHLLSHTSGLRDVPAADTALAEDWPIEQLLAEPGIRQTEPGEMFHYCNLNYGLLGCIMEYITNQPLQDIFEERLFAPLGMRGAIDPAQLDPNQIMPICRVLPYHPEQETVIPSYASSRMEAADPHFRYHHTPGSLYTDAESLSLILTMIAGHGAYEGRTVISSDLVRKMVRTIGRYGKSSPTLSYGLGLLIIEDRELSPHRIIGHQGYAYGCADAAFYEEGTGRQVIFLNGGCSEARKGRLGISNWELLRFALKKEMPAWK